MTLPSIYTLIPSETGGSIARAGFTYQDHVAISYLFCLLNDPSIKEVWLETEDDILLIIDDGVNNHVEMIQVKSNELTSRWSISQLIDSELLEKSLKRGRCKEDVKYSIVTSYGINEDLEVLKHEYHSKERTKTSLDSLSKKIKQKKKDIPKNAKGHDLDYWIGNCRWHVYPNSIDDLKNKNIRELEALLDTKHCLLPYDQRNELYQKLLAYVSKKSESKEQQDKKITKEEFKSWLDQKLDSFIVPNESSIDLKRKLRDALLTEDIINSANELRHSYRRETLNHEYVSASKINKSKLQILELLQKLKIDYDSGKVVDSNNIKLTPYDFHSLCLERIEEYSTANDIDSYISKGCMYEITDRCSHRFTNPQS